MEHPFDVKLVKEIGFYPAIIFKNILLLIDKNKSNQRHFYNGKYWTCNSIKAFNQLFPYMSEKTIRNSLKKLEDSGFIETGNFNKSSCDRTKWYSIKKIDLQRNFTRTERPGKLK